MLPPSSYRMQCFPLSHADCVLRGGLVSWRSSPSGASLPLPLPPLSSLAASTAKLEPPSKGQVALLLLGPGAHLQVSRHITASKSPSFGPHFVAKWAAIDSPFSNDGLGLPTNLGT